MIEFDFPCSETYRRSEAWQNGIDTTPYSPVIVQLQDIQTTPPLNEREYAKLMASITPPDKPKSTFTPRKQAPLKPAKPKYEGIER